MTTTVLRTYTITMFAGLLDKSPDDPIPFNIEKSIYNWTIRKIKAADDIPSWENKRFRENYKYKALSIKANIVNKNSNLKERILSGHVITRTIANLTPDQLHITGLWAKTIQSRDNIQLRADMALCLMHTKKHGLFKCSKCKSQKTTYYEMQTRSADEPMTAFIQCLDCGKRWKS